MKRLEEEKETCDLHILQVEDYTVEIKFRTDTEETIEDRMAVLARRLSQTLLEEEE